MISDSEELIPFTEHDGRRLVPARELHSFLQNGKHFSDWFRHRCKKYRLTEGVDYVTLPSTNDKGRPAIEYGLSLSAAKELSMIEASDRGKEARLYFLRKEALANVLQDGVAKMLAAMQERLDSLEKHVHLSLPPSGSYTIMGFARLHGRAVSREEAANLGKRAVYLSQVQGHLVTTVPDARFGHVNSYSREVLEAVFQEHFPHF